MLGVLDAEAGGAWGPAEHPHPSLCLRAALGRAGHQIGKGGSEAQQQSSGSEQEQPTPPSLDA